MADVDIDRHAAAAEAALDRVDDGVDDADLVDPDSGAGVDLSDGMHLEDADESYAAEVGVDGEEDGHIAPRGVDVIDELCEAFNARDLDAVMDLCSEDCETPGLAVNCDDLGDELDQLWERRPTVTMTRAVHDDVGVGVLWERGESATWAPIATIHVDLDEDGMIGVLELSDDVALLDELEAEPPDGDMMEGSRWEEWAEGEDV